MNGIRAVPCRVDGLPRGGACPRLLHGRETRLLALQQVVAELLLLVQLLARGRQLLARGGQLTVLLLHALVEHRDSSSAWGTGAGGGEGSPGPRRQSRAVDPRWKAAAATAPEGPKLLELVGGVLQASLQRHRRIPQVDDPRSVRVAPHVLHHFVECAKARAGPLLAVQCLVDALLGGLELPLVASGRHAGVREEGLWR